MTENKLKIFVTYHNDKYPIFKSDVFEPIFCGKYFHNEPTELLCDNTGNNISNKNIYSYKQICIFILKNYSSLFSSNIFLIELIIVYLPYS